MLILDGYEKMCMIELSEHEKEKMKADIEKLLVSFQVLSEKDLSEVEPLTSVLEIHNIFREDKVAKCLSREEVLMNAPSQIDGYYQVPKTLG